MTPLVNWAIPFARPVRIAIAVTVLVPIGMVLGVPMPAGIQLLRARAPQMLTWAWGMNGALSVVGATLAIFIAMNWGFQVTLLVASATYLIGLGCLFAAERHTIAEISDFRFPYLALGLGLRRAEASEQPMREGYAARLPVKTPQTFSGLGVIGVLSSP